MSRLTQLLAALVLVLAALAVGASASHSDDVYDHDSDAITVTYNQSACESHQPYLDIRSLDVRPSGVYCSVYESPDHDTTVYAYWVRYPVQSGYSSEDSHLGDREPVYVHVSESGSIEKVVYSEYHYYSAVDTNPSTVEINGSVHPTLRVVAPHHQFISESVDNGDGQLHSVHKFADEYAPSDSAVQRWYDNGWRSVDFDAVFNPWSVDGESHYWSDETRTGRLSAQLYGISDRVEDLTGVDTADMMARVLSILD